MIFISRLPIPVASYQCKLGANDFACRELDLGETFSLAPTAETISFAQATTLANAGTGCDRFNAGDVAHDLEVHAAIVSNRSGGVNNLTGTVAQGKAPIAAFSRGYSSPAIR